MIVRIKSLVIPILGQIETEIRENIIGLVVQARSSIITSKNRLDQRICSENVKKGEISHFVSTDNIMDAFTESPNFKEDLSLKLFIVFSVNKIEGLIFASSDIEIVEFKITNFSIPLEDVPVL